MKNLLFTALSIILFITSCSDDDTDYTQRVTGFDVPELTESNSIQFSIEVDGRATSSFYVGGKKVAVDWGDGSTIEKDDLSKNRNGKEYDRRETFAHTYSKSGVYTIKIWSQEIVDFYLNTTFINRSYVYSDLKLDYCPVMENLSLENIDAGNLEFPNLPIKRLTIQAIDNLTSINISALSNLSELYMTNLPVLMSLDVSSNNKLWELNCSNSPVLESINLGKNTKMARLSLWDCNNLATIDLDGVPNLGVIDIVRTGIKTLDITKQTTLSEFHCIETELSSIDLSQNKSLYTLVVTNNKFTDLDIRENKSLAILNCERNQLTDLDVTLNGNLETVNITDNKFEKEALDKIFTDLPESKYKKAKSMPPAKYCAVAFYNNPGAKACDASIIEDKGWVVVPENK